MLSELRLLCSSFLVKLCILVRMKISLKRDHQRMEHSKTNLEAEYFKSYYSKAIIRLYFIDIRVGWFVYGLCTFRFHFLFVRSLYSYTQCVLCFVYIPFHPLDGTFIRHYSVREMVLFFFRRFSIFRSLRNGIFVPSMDYSFD